jgi:hypothetical protein
MTAKYKSKRIKTTNLCQRMWPCICTHPRPPASKEPASSKESRWVNRSEARNLRDTAKLIKSQQDKDTESEYDEDFTTVTNKHKEKTKRAKNNRITTTKQKW